MSLFSEIENAINNRVNLLIDKIAAKYGINNNELNSLWKEIYEGKNINDEPKPQEPKPQEPKPQEPKPQEPKPQEPKPQEPKPQEPKPQEPKPQEPKRGNKKEKTPDIYCTYIITRGPKKGNQCNSKCRKGPYCSKHKSKLKTKESEVIEDESKIENVEHVNIKDEKDEKDEIGEGESQSGEFDTDDIINEMSQHKTIHLSPISKSSSSDENKKLVDSYEKSISSNELDNELELAFKNLTSKDPTESDVIDILSEIQE